VHQEPALDAAVAAGVDHPSERRSVARPVQPARADYSHGQPVLAMVLPDKLLGGDLGPRVIAPAVQLLAEWGGFVEDQPFAEIARIMGKREGTLRMRSRRALKKLKTALETRGFIDGRDGRKAETPAGARGEDRYLPAKSAARSS